ncbi:MAG: site-specific integrase [Oscillospiraceae bacterium]|jgi:integrase|nr:site-specific integrase [Oscillospiraceae bacterium]
MHRRANGEGSVRQLKNGSWEARIMVGTRADGKPVIKTFTAKKRAVAAKRLADFIAGVRTAAAPRPARETVGEWMEAWLCGYAATQVKTSTRVSYENIARNQIIPRLGRFRLTSLQRGDVDEFYQSLLRDGRADGKGGLSPKTVRNVHIVLHRALREAVTRGRIDKNPASAANVPSPKSARAKRRFEVLTLGEQRALTALCGQDPAGAAVVTALNTGLRLGELLGLRWSDVDFAAGTISVSRQLSRLRDYTPGAETRTRLALENGAKTGSSVRVIPMDRTLRDRLLAYKAAQNAGTPPESPGDGPVPPDMVFTGRDGGFFDPATFRYRYRRLLREAGAGRHTVHALRHTFATRALEAGVPVKAVSQILGHAGSQITMDTYSHVLPVFQAEAMTRIASYIAGTAPRKSRNVPYNPARSARALRPGG